MYVLELILQLTAEQMRKREVLKEVKPLLPHPVDTKLVLVTCQKEAHFCKANEGEINSNKLSENNRYVASLDWLALQGLEGAETTS